MKLKTYLSSFLLIVALLFVTVSTISIYTAQNQMELIQNRSLREYQTILASLSRDLTAIQQREGRVSTIVVDSLLHAYRTFYEEYGIFLSLREGAGELLETQFLEVGSHHYFVVTGKVSQLAGEVLEIQFDVTDTMASVASIQRALLLILITFSSVAALALYILMNKLFRLLKLVATASRKIAAGNFNERISVKGSKEVAALAEDFNKMADEIEQQIRNLEAEAIAKQQFVDNFAHEIRTPLTSVLGYAEYLQRVQMTEEELIDTSQYIIDEAKHMEKTANSLLKLATLRNFVPKNTEVPVANLFEEVKQTLGRPLRERYVELQWETEVKTLWVQKDLLKTLLLNLCANSLKAINHQHGMIRISATQKELTVSDNGSGIPAEALGKVTEPFYRVDKARSREAGGAGLGLTLCRQIVDLYQAELLMASEVGKGTTVKVVWENEHEKGTH